ncbi:phage coat protein [Xanthomonas campestris pv. merremiae]|uniref:phage coat protein n=1 Tax=Xanthomonas citri TaxID=346 RepID=UPI000B5C2D04|nr:phage coat protein [Xanthomonas citri]ASL00845.1 phage coat protein [Xanthomonas citri pv. vignicola]MBV6839634.1 phage coat protein [Xanthomonas campestris pv. merremiae]MBZ3932838.1 phage coat protein [Xanthomonas campestris pv. merremiae]
MYAGWFTDLTAWVWRAVKAVWHAFADFIGDLFVMWLEQSLSAILYVLSLLPMPDFMKGQSIGAMLGNAGSTILWFADVFMIGPSLVAVGAAMIFYLLRRVLTLGIW